MWNIYNWVMHWGNYFDTQQWLMVLLVAAVLGFMCMRGFGSQR